MQNEKTSKSKYLISAILIILILVIGRQVFYVSKANGMNVLLISIDTLSPNHMSIYGYDKKTTPSIDKFADNAMVFTNATTVVPMTHPSLAALMTGRSPFETRIISNQDPGLSQYNKSLATRLYEHGFKTAAFISADNTITQGFEDVEYKNSKYYFFDDSNRVKYSQTEDNATEDLVSNANKWITKNKESKFFAWVHLSEPHAPYFPPDNLLCKFNEKHCNKIKEKSLQELEEIRAKFQSCYGGEIDNDTLEIIQTLYDGAVASADEYVGDILDNLKNEGLSENTIVIIYGDHGEGFDHDYYFNHGEVLYQSAVRIPLIIRDPRTTRKGFLDMAVQSTDILPTILDLLRIKQERPQVSGRSLASLFYPISFHGTEKRYVYYLNSSYTKFAISDGRFKYILSHPESCLYKNQEEELYDLLNDPAEKTNLFAEKRAIAKRLKIALTEYLGTYNLPLYPNEDVSRDAINKLNELRSIQNQ